MKRNILPQLTETEIQTLIEDIRTRGPLDPIICFQGHILVDGEQSRVSKQLLEAAKNSN